MKAIIFAVAIVLATSFPLYKQCDDRWRNDALGNGGGKTICQAGCLMSSMAMFMSPKVKISAATITPKNLNSWLKVNGGYASGNLFVWGSVAKLGLSYVGKTTDKNTMKNYINQGYGVILNVKNGGHWVLATGHTTAGFTVNDPGATKTSYTNAEVVGAGVYRPIGKLASPEEDLSMFTFEEFENLDNIETVFEEPSF